jgi:thiol:disulfide interchange protein DsbA
MKLLSSIAVLLLLGLVACSSEENTADTVAAPAEDATVDSTEATPVAADEAITDEARPQTVEESGGEPDEADTGDKPIILAQAATTTTNQDWKYEEGKHYHRLTPTQPTLGGADKVEVAEFFWYGCAHSYEFESYVNPWAKTAPINSRFVRIPASWSPLVNLHAQLYYTEEALVKIGKIEDPAAFRAAIFAEYHQRGNRMASKGAIQELFARFGVSGDDFNKTWSSFEVSQKLRIAQDLSRRYAVSGVPAIVVNGKYRLGKTDTGTYPVMLDVVDELIARETVR